jgi:hypothetical protein
LRWPVVESEFCSWAFNALFSDYGHDSYSDEDDYGHGHKGGYGKKKHHKHKSYGGHK